MVSILFSGVTKISQSGCNMLSTGWDHMVSVVCRKLRINLFTLLVAIVIAGCSDGGGGGGIGGTGKQVIQDGLIYGVVDGFGSIIINDQRFETDSAQILVDGEEMTLADLSIGMSLSATVDTINKAAIKLQYQPNVSGPVRSIDQSARSINVLGQTVIFSDQTVFDALVQSGLSIGQLIEVSGSRDGSQNIIATYMREPAMDQDIYVVGTVEVDTESGAMHVSGATLNTQIAAATNGMSVAEFESRYLAPGSIVRLQTTAAAASDSATADGFTLAVLGVEVMKSPEYKAGDSVQLLGIVSGSIQDDGLFVQGFELTFDGETETTSNFGLPIDFPDVPQGSVVLINGIAEADNGPVLISTIQFLDRD